jgi:hypothetical protein
MEKRWSKRVVTAWDVLIVDCEDRVCQATVRNVGVEGMFLETDTAPILTKRLLRIQAGGPGVGDGSTDSNSFQFDVYVIHRSHWGLAVMFVTHDLDFFRRLEQWLYTAGERRNGTY